MDKPDEKSINIKSSTIEKGLEIAKDFIGKILGPTAEEVGLLISDPIRFYRFKNQVKILEKADKFVKSRKIKVKEIPTKILVPLIENASLEDEEDMQDEWATLIANMADSEKNLNNHILPFILGQISIQELETLKNLLSREISFDLIPVEIDKLSEGGQYKFNKLKIDNLAIIKKNIERDGFTLQLKPFEIGNLNRLGLIKSPPPQSIQNFAGISQTIPMSTYNLEAAGYRITDLGRLFVEALSRE